MLVIHCPIILYLFFKKKKNNNKQTPIFLTEHFWRIKTTIIEKKIMNFLHLYLDIYK